MNSTGSDLTGSKAVAYLRVSSNDQVERGTIAVQRREVTRWAKAHGVKVVQWCEDEAISGKLDHTNRPGLACAIDAVEAKRANVVVMWKLDRLARELTVQEATLGLLWRSGARVFTIDEGEILADDPADPMRTAMRQMMGVFAQLERGMIRARMEAGRRAKAERGGYTGGAPRFGVVADDRELVANEAEAVVIDRILAEHRAGRSIRGICQLLNTERVPAKRGGLWHPPTVARVVQRHS